MMDDQQEPVVATRSTNLGDQLKQAREHKKYSVAEVAAQLRLTKDIVGYLENQQWEKLNGRTYARGYFASYVKFLGLPYEEMLAVFNLEYSATEPTLNLYQQRHSVDDKPFPWSTLLFISIALGIGWFGYQQWQNTQLASQPVLPEVSMPESSFDNSVVEPLLMSEGPALEQQDSSESVIAEDYETIGSFDLDENDFTEIDAAEAITDDAIQTEPVQQVEVTDTSPALLDTASTLKLSFSGECWVEVTNADAKVLVSKVMRAQDSFELSSEQPLKVLLGRAEVATVIFNNQQVDLSPFTQGNVARLTLGVES